MASNGKTAGILVCMLLAAMLAACGSPRHAESQPDGANTRTLRLGHFPNLTHATAIVAVESGIFARHLADVDLQVLTFNAGPAAVEALFAGGLDAAYIGPNPAINAHVRSGVR